ncbi:baseplate J/gp47 family protein [Desertibacillus haloalkaliphilus]|uniref:baseplate J/gp47 family protein n=1 Tax=Desertibacillus haloalkaliphilus TaxID=1328930 RepID=UPI001C278D77|nr:baseplate J/gp47 family protein [Desertibacillus haloalkaliphilus]MBU8908495.1 baseplate J/gp47 family protein [Desertibacillus haloalkaliphilus]
MLTQHGFKRKRHKELFEEMEQSAKEKFGDNTNTSERSFLGILLRLFAWFLAIMYQLAENVYNSGHIDTATGASLDKLVKRNLIKRRPAEKAKYEEFVVIGDPGQTIESGFVVSRQDGFTYETTEAVTLDENGKGVVIIIATQAGSDGNTPANTITEIVNPAVGISEVYNPTPVSGGREKETDSELRKRYFLSLSAGGAPTTNGIRASVLGVEGVRTVHVIENNTNEYDSDGRPPKSFEVHVLGGDPKKVAQAIFDRKAAGIEPYGTEEQIITDDSGNDHTVRFSHSDEVPIHVEVEVVTNSDFPTSGYNDIKTRIIEYIGGLDEDGNTYNGLSNGQDVLFIGLVDAIKQTPGVDDIPVLKVGKNESDLTQYSNVQIANTEVASTDYEKVMIS